STSTPISLSFFPVTATPNPYTLSLHDALPILSIPTVLGCVDKVKRCRPYSLTGRRCSVITECNRFFIQYVRKYFQFFKACISARSEEHTSELQSRENLVCRLLLEKKKYVKINT